MKFTQQDLDFIKQEYPKRLTSEIASELDVDVRRIYEVAYKVLNVRKSTEFLTLEQSGRINKLSKLNAKYKYPKGNTPHNKGKKGSEWLTAESKKAMQPTQFKKGEKPHNAYKDWAEIIHADSKGFRYWKIKVPEESKLVFKHVWLYTKVFGQPAKGSIIIFKDKNSLNCVPENLEVITRSENMKRNSIIRYPTEIRNTIKLVSQLDKKIQNYEKQN